MSEEKNSRTRHRQQGLKCHCLQYRCTGYFLYPIRLNPVKDKTVLFIDTCTITYDHGLGMHPDLEMECLHFSLKWQFLGKLVNMQGMWIKDPTYCIVTDDPTSWMILYWYRSKLLLLGQRYEKWAAALHEPRHLPQDFVFFDWKVLQGPSRPSGPLCPLRPHLGSLAPTPWERPGPRRQLSVFDTEGDNHSCSPAHFRVHPKMLSRLQILGTPLAVQQLGLTLPMQEDSIPRELRSYMPLREKNLNRVQILVNPDLSNKRIPHLTGVRPQSTPFPCTGLKDFPLILFNTFRFPHPGHTRSPKSTYFLPLSPTVQQWQELIAINIIIIHSLTF